MGYPQGLQVDPARVRATAARVAEVSQALTKTPGARGDGLAPGGVGDGWACAAAARAAASAWCAFLGRLAGAVDGVASDLRATADSYEQTDEQAAHSLGGGGRYAV